MKPTGVNLNDILCFDPDTVVKMPGIVCFHPYIEVKTIDNEVGMSPRGQNLIEWFVFDANAAVKRIAFVINQNENQPAPINWLIVYNLSCFEKMVWP